MSWSVQRSALAKEHDLVALWVRAHGQVGRFTGGVGHRFVAKQTPCSHDLSSASDDIFHLKTETCPCGLILSTGVDGKRRSANIKLRDVFVLAGYFSSEDISVKGDGAWSVLGPDDVFDSFDFHSTADSQL